MEAWVEPFYTLTRYGRAQRGGRDIVGPLGGRDYGQSTLRSNTLAGMLHVVIRSFNELKGIKLKATVNQERAVARRLGGRKVFDAMRLAGWQTSKTSRRHLHFSPVKHYYPTEMK